MATANSLVLADLRHPFLEAASPMAVVEDTAKAGVGVLLDSSLGVF